MPLNLNTADREYRLNELRTYDVQSLTKADLDEVHEHYNDYKDEWDFLEAAYEGTKALLDYGALKQHERESNDNFSRRKDQAISFDYSRSVIDLFNFYMFKNPIRRSVGTMADDEVWQEFEKDANMEGDPLDNFMMEGSRKADTLGHVGILVDKPNIKAQTVADEKAAGAYPYFALYKPQSILDWKFIREESGRRTLVYLKLMDDEGKYRLWFEDHWEVWEIPEDDAGKQGEPQMIADGDNELGVIPFVWLYCQKSNKRQIGRSDISNIARIDVSIMNNLSQGEEVIDYAAFPMLMKPWGEPGSQPEGDQDEVGVTAVLGFPPDQPEAKPEWLASETKDPIDAILAWMLRKIEEIYRSSNAGGLAATEIQSQAKSGVALKTEFQLLNGKLIKKSEGVVKAMIACVRFWVMWQGKEDIMDEIKIERPKTFEVENLAADLENMLSAKMLVQSVAFRKALARMAARMVLTTADDDTLAEIDDDIDSMDEEEPLDSTGAGQFLAGQNEPQKTQPAVKVVEGGGGQK